MAKMTDTELMTEIALKLTDIASEYKGVSESQLVRCTALTAGFMMTNTSMAKIEDDEFLLTAHKK